MRGRVIYRISKHLPLLFSFKQFRKKYTNMYYTPSAGIKQIAISTVLISVAVSYEQTCPRGEYLHTPSSGSDVCQKCKSGTFMSDDNHTNRICQNCTHIQNSTLEKFLSHCIRTQDAIIICVQDFYRANNKTCLPCTQCEYSGRRCQNYSDAICCPDENHDFIDNKCTLVCGPGYYKNSSMNKCLPCTSGTYNNEINHTFESCSICSKAEAVLNQAIKQSCNTTHDAVIGCKKKYFMAPSTNPSAKINCDKCVECSSTSKTYVGRNCSDTSNTVCCSEPGMDVRDTSTGPECFKRTIVSTTPDSAFLLCGEGHYLDSNHKDSCKPCENGTYQDRNNHTESTCKNCSEFTGNYKPKSCPEIHNLHAESTKTIIIVIIIFIVVIITIFIVVLCWRHQNRPVENNNNQRNVPREDMEMGELETAFIPFDLPPEGREVGEQETAFIVSDQANSQLR